MKMKPRIISSVKGSLLYCFLEIYIDAEYPVLYLFVWLEYLRASINYFDKNSIFLKVFLV